MQPFYLCKKCVSKLDHPYAMLRLKSFTPVFFLVILASILSIQSANSQVINRIPFKQRVGTPPPAGNIFRVKGDFGIFGNTNLTFLEYGDAKDNSMNEMIWIDVDNDTTTANSSSASLVFSEENGADPSCTEIRYAGLYWAGRSNLGRGLAWKEVIGNIPGRPKEISPVLQQRQNKDTIEYTSFVVDISRETDENQNLYPVYRIRSITAPNSISFYFFNTWEPRVRYNTFSNSSLQSVSNLKITIEDSLEIATFDPISITDNGITVTVNRIVRPLGRQLGEASESEINLEVTISGTYIPKLSRLVDFDKRRVKLKGPGTDEYVEIRADGNAVVYPVDELGEIYLGYADVTDYVSQHGMGEYTVADIALDFGLSDPTGYFGQWGIVVVYENSKMDWRDVTIFDGFSFIRTEVLQTLAFSQILIEGFSAVGEGPVDLKMGIMAGEGDRTIEGDFLELNDQAGGWVRLQHPLNSPTNFFNSSIYTPVRGKDGSLIETPRNPSLPNSTGIDIAMWDVPNPDNSIIANSQSSINFRFGTVQDVFTLYMFAFSVRSYVPDIQALHKISKINGLPPGDNPEIKPREEVSYDVELRNFGTEAIEKGKIVIPLPHTMEFVGLEISPTGFGTAVFDPNLGRFGSIVWNLPEVPVLMDPNVLIAKLTYTLRVTDDCFILANEFCDARVLIDGGVSGVGFNSKSVFSDIPFIKGFKEGNCLAEELTGALELPIVGLSEFAAANCKGFALFPGFEDVDIPVFCSGNGTVALTDFIQPSDSLFTVYFFADSIGGTPVTEYFVNLGTLGTQKIWVTEGYDFNCTGLRVPITVTVIKSSPAPITNDVQICTTPGFMSVFVQPMFGYQMKYYPDNDPNSVPIDSIPMLDTSIPGEYEFWVSQFFEGECESPRSRIKLIFDDCSLYPQIDISVQVAPQKYSRAGEVITYTITVENPGRVPLLDVNVSDGISGNRYVIPVIQPGEKSIITVTYVVTEGDMDAGVITNFVSGFGKDEKGREAHDSDYVEIYPFHPEFLDFGISLAQEKCKALPDPNGYVEITYNKSPQTGSYVLIRKEDGLRFTGTFSMQQNVRISAPAGSYELQIKDESDAAYIYPEILIIAATPIVSFEVPVEIDDCLVHRWFAINSPDLDYRLTDPDGTIVPFRDNSYYELTKTGNYKLLGSDPKGKLCPLEKTFFANIRKPQDVKLSALPFCAEQAFTTIEIDQNTAGMKIRWSKTDKDQALPLADFDDLATIDVALEGEYAVSLTDGEGCVTGIGKISVVRSKPEPPVLLSVYTICPKEQRNVVLEAGTAFSSAVWYLEDVEVGNSISFSPEKPGNYKLLAFDFQGCEATTNFLVEEKCEPSLRYPTAVIPGVAEKSFYVYPDNLMSTVEVSITNRWGELIYYCADNSPVYGAPSSCVWNGTLGGQPVPNGAYALLIRYRLKENNEYRVERGVVNVID